MLEKCSVKNLPKKDTNVLVGQVHSCRLRRFANRNADDLVELFPMVDEHQWIFGRVFLDAGNRDGEFVVFEPKHANCRLSTLMRVVVSTDNVVQVGNAIGLASLDFWYQWIKIGIFSEFFCTRCWVLVSNHIPQTFFLRWTLHILFFFVALETMVFWKRFPYANFFDVEEISCQSLLKAL